MTEIRTNPRPPVVLHPSYVIWWAIWLAGLAGFVFFHVVETYSWGIWAARAHFGYFVVVEGLGFFRKGPGDTLSEVMQAINARAGIDSRWWQSWRVIVVGITLMVSYQAGYVAAWSPVYGPWKYLTLGLIVAGMVGLWNLYHWLNREKHG